MEFPFASGRNDKTPDPEDLLRFFRRYADSYKNDVATLELKLMAGGTSHDRYFRPYPVDNRQQLHWILSYMEKHYGDIRELEREIVPINAEFSRIRKRYHDTYYLTLAGIFRRLVPYCKGTIPPGGTPAGYSNPLEFEAWIIRRDYLEALKNEIEPEVEIGAEVTRLLECDESFISLIPYAKEKQGYSPRDLYYAPDEIWWRHLVKKFGQPAGLAEIPMYLD
jgi:hypothetical protein